FKQIKSEVNRQNSPLQFIEHFHVDNLSMQEENLDDIEYIHVNGQSPSFNINYYANLVIYAIGFGIELGVKTNHSTPSYWRNESYQQSLLDPRKTQFYIVGTGDGALIDLCRLIIKDFS